MADYFDKEKFAEEMDTVSLTENQKQILLNKMRENDKTAIITPYKPKSSYGVWIKSVAAVLVFALLFGGILYFFGGKTGNTAQLGSNTASRNTFLLTASAAEEIPSGADPVKFICGSQEGSTFGEEFDENSEYSGKYLLYDFQTGGLQIEGTNIKSVDFSTDQKSFLFDFDSEDEADESYQTYLSYIQNNVIAGKKISNGVFETSAEYLENNQYNEFSEKLCDNFTFVMPESNGEQQSLEIGNFLKFLIEISADSENSHTDDLFYAFSKYSKWLSENYMCDYDEDEYLTLVKNMYMSINDYLNEMFETTQVEITVNYNDGTTQQQLIVPKSYYDTELGCVSVYWETV